MSEQDRIILAFSGKKGSGKDSACKFIHAIAFVMGPKPITDKAYVTENGDLIVNTKDGEMGFDLIPSDKETVVWMENNVWPFIKRFAFADILKDICIQLFGLSYNSMYGNDDEKNSPTHLLWENFPLESWVDNDGKTYVGKKQNKEDSRRTGPMSGREVLQFVGTNLIRKMYPNVFAEALKRKIEYDDPMISIITDLRFPNELDVIHSMGGKVIRFTRDPYNDDHESEHMLDEDKYNWSNFDYVIDNKDLSLEQTHDLLYQKLVEWQIIRTS